MIQVGSHVLYAQAHIPGSEYIGPRHRRRGFAVRLRKRVESLPRTRLIVLYCGVALGVIVPTSSPLMMPYVPWDLLTSRFCTSPRIRGQLGGQGLSRGKGRIALRAETKWAMFAFVASVCSHDSFLPVQDIAANPHSQIPAPKQQMTRSRLRASTTRWSAASPFLLSGEGRLTRFLGHMVRSLSRGNSSFRRTAEKVQRTRAADCR